MIELETANETTLDVIASSTSRSKLESETTEAV